MIYIEVVIGLKSQFANRQIVILWLIMYVSIANDFIFYSLVEKTDKWRLYQKLSHFIEQNLVFKVIDRLIKMY